MLAFHCVDLGNGRSAALVAWSEGQSARGIVQFAVYDLVLGTCLPDFTFPFAMTRSPVILDVANTHNFVAIVQDSNLYVHTLRGPAAHRTWRNAQKVGLTCVRVHPLDEHVVATGDEKGRIFVWRQLFNEAPCAPVQQLYHWHHTRVNTLCFSETGSSMYSGGDEAVLVRWNVAHAEQRSFLPRMSGCAVHLAVSAGNEKIALATNDNGIQVLNSQFKALAVVQNFTWVPDDRTVGDRFPIGLRVNPRNSALMLNGRVGHLQFFSTHTRSLLHNLDTTAQNRLSLETAKVLYNTCITHAAISMEWLVTAEMLDDQQTSVELRMKFWHWNVERQTYVLNTQVELPHDGGLMALEFSSAYETEQLMCASAGKDNVVKVWTLEVSDDVNKKARFWACTGKTDYKNLPVKSLAFSADGSLLSVGYGNTLCVYQAETLRLKCVLSSPAGLDGSANKITLNISQQLSAGDENGTGTPNAKQKTNKVAKLEKRRKMLQAVKAYLANESDSDLVRTICAKLNKLSSASRLQSVPSAELTLKEQEIVHSKIMAQNELNFYQKLELFGELSLHSQAPKELAAPFATYFSAQLGRLNSVRSALSGRMQRLPEHQRFSAARKQFNYVKRVGMQRRISARVRDLLSFEEGTKVPSTLTPRKRTNSEKSQKPSQAEKTESTTVPVKQVAQIKHVAFGSGEYSHLVIVCTERRLLIWNLLTLRLQTAIKLSVHRLTVDPYTSLVAVFTVYNERK